MKYQIFMKEGRVEREGRNPKKWILSKILKKFSLLSLGSHSPKNQFAKLSS
jgi:hypothetical protein